MIRNHVARVVNHRDKQKTKKASSSSRAIFDLVRPSDESLSMFVLRREPGHASSWADQRRCFSRREQASHRRGSTTLSCIGRSKRRHPTGVGRLAKLDTMRRKLTETRAQCPRRPTQEKPRNRCWLPSADNRGLPRNRPKIPITPS